MSQDTLYVQMLGRFAVHYGERAITFNKAASSKTVRLMQILLLCGEEGISKAELLDALYGWNDETSAVSRNRNLNKLIRRLRENLVQYGFPEEPYIVVTDGLCCWKSSFPVHLDALEFEKKVRGAKDEQIGLLEQAFALYTGELLPMNQCDIWFFNRGNYFKALYVHTIHVLAKHYHECSDFRRQVELYQRAIMIYPFDNWQTELIRCHLERNHQEEALRVYNDTMELYAREMGSPPSEEMQQCFEMLKLQNANFHKKVRDVREWKYSETSYLGEGNLVKIMIDDKASGGGACYCPYPSFVDYCKLLIRLKERLALPAIMMFLTMTPDGKKGESEEQIQMDLLKNAIGDSLRRGDAYTRYGSRHYILMLTNIKEDDCAQVFRRIENSYKNHHGGKDEVWYQTMNVEQI